MSKSHMLTMFAAVAGMTIGFSGAASAGQHLDAPVTIERQPDGSGSATGAMGDARMSDDEHSFLICQVDTSSTGDFLAQCFAQDSAANQVGCFTTEPNLMTTIMTAPSDAYVRMDWDTIGRCTHVTVVWGSLFQVKLP